jgi:hypothetical protein
MESRDERLLRVCPTRIDHAPVLFAHKVVAGTCQDRQRGHYHKCFTCAWNHAWVRAHGVPDNASAVERRSFVKVG